MKTLADRFRQWYAHERDCNAKVLGMLQSVPAEKQSLPSFQRAVDKMAHLVAARQRWLFRLGVWTEQPAIFPKDTKVSDLPEKVSKTEEAWVEFLNTLDDAALNREIEWQIPDGKRYRWNIEGILTQTNGHAWYHRGQIAMLVADLGGAFVDTDYIFFCKLQPIENK
ncbi:MAG: DinB family protein [Planctomycetia bacterium]|nr:DinB family protein [Planctomycetia bacterium]